VQNGAGVGGCIVGLPRGDHEMNIRLGAPLSLGAAWHRNPGSWRDLRAHL
jgi:hypothetical protein